MQYTHPFRIDKVNLRDLWPFALKSLFFLTALFFIYSSLEQKKYSIHYLLIYSQNSIYNPYFLFLIFLLPVNLGLEAYKWKLLARKVEKLSFYQAFLGVLVGASLGFITPHSIGDYAGRIFLLKKIDRIKSIGAIVITRFSQLFITLFIGFIIILILPNSPWNVNNIHLETVVKLFAFLGIGILFTSIVCYKTIIRQFLKIKLAQPYLKVINTYSSKDFVHILFISFLRYMVFAIQFALAMFATGLSPALSILFAGIGFIFLCKSIVPTFLDLGIREASAIYFFSFYGYDNNLILLACLLLWTINIFLPVIAGSLFIFKMKIFVSDK